MRKILVVVGNYSEVIVMAPLVHRLRALPSLQTVIYVTDQHLQMFNQMFGHSGIQPDEELGQIQLEQGSSVLRCIDQILEKHQPDCVLAHGDSATEIETFLLQNPVGNVEAGLRMYELHYPSSQETNCREIDLIGTCYFVPSEGARKNLLLEGVASEKIYLADSMVVDALRMVTERISNDDALKADLAASFPFLDSNRRLILVTRHRHGNQDGRLESLCRAIKRLAMRPDVQVVYPVHPDSRMNEVVDEIFANHPNITLIQPQDYVHFVYLMQAAYLVLTDPDDFLKEALSLGKPVLVMRDAAERPEAVDAGTIKLVGTDGERILRECTMFLDDPSYYRAFSSHRNPYGDAHASKRIVEILLR